MSADLRAALEAALRDDPDDLAAHMAYADLLTEQGDPRGEFCRVQLALERPGLSPNERESLRFREKEILDRHKVEWLGADFAAVLIDRDREAFTRLAIYDYFFDGFAGAFARGWLERLSVMAVEYDVLTPLLAAPITGLLRELTICSLGDEDSAADLSVLASYPWVRSLRSLSVGDPDRSYLQADNLEHLLPFAPRLEELRLHQNIVDDPVLAAPIPNLRTLDLNHVNHDYPLDTLGANPTISNLRELFCWPHAIDPDRRQAYIHLGVFEPFIRSPYLRSLEKLHLYLTDIGDDGVRALIGSGKLSNLVELDLWSGTVTDEGARLLAAADMPRMRKLRLAGNQLTPAGVAALRRLPCEVDVDGQHSAEAIAAGEHLFEGDME